MVRLAGQGKKKKVLYQEYNLCLGSGCGMKNNVVIYDNETQIFIDICICKMPTGRKYHKNKWKSMEILFFFISYTAREI